MAQKTNSRGAMDASGASSGEMLGCNRTENINPDRDQQAGQSHASGK